MPAQIAGRRARADCTLQGFPTDAARESRPVAGTPSAQYLTVMKDVLFIVVTAAFFALSWAYTKSFDRL